MSRSNILDTTISTEQNIEEKEFNRLLILNKYEEEIRLKGFQNLAGIDEAGRGPLAGPVVAAVCVVPPGIYIPRINDSKLLSEKVRQDLFDRITQDQRIKYHISLVEPDEIDRINIYQATIVAMMRAVAGLDNQPDYLLVDGLNLGHSTIPCLKIIKGDQLSQSIAAASILAKVTRDRIMKEYHELYPVYGFNQNKGYGTAKHLAALKENGPCKIHRKSFEPIKSKLYQT